MRCGGGWQYGVVTDGRRAVFGYLMMVVVRPRFAFLSSCAIAEITTKKWSRVNWRAGAERAIDIEGRREGESERERSSDKMKKRKDNRKQKVAVLHDVRKCKI
jgi:hypothetical protein